MVKFNVNKSNKNKNKKSKKSQRVILVKAPQRSAIRTKKPPRAGQSPYKWVLTDPCSPLAAGARVPGTWSFPSTTCKLKSRVELAPDINGNFSYCFIGHPTLWSWTNNTSTVASSSFPRYAGCDNFDFGCDTTYLQNKFSTFRSVGNGIRIMNMQPALSAKGRITIARVPMGKTGFGPNMLNSLDVAPSQQLSRLCGISAVATGGAIPMSIIELPESAEYTVSELLEKEIVMANIPTSPNAFKWSETSDSSQIINQFYEFENVAVDSTTGLPNGSTADRDAFAECTEGWTCLLIRGEGFPTDPSVVLSLSTTSHLEGTTAITNSSGGATYVSDSVATASREDAATVVRNVMDRSFNIVREVGASMYNNADLIRGAVHFAGRGRSALMN